MYCTLIDIQQWRWSSCFINFAPTAVLAVSLTAVSNELDFLQSGLVCKQTVFLLFLVLNR